MGAVSLDGLIFYRFVRLPLCRGYRQSSCERQERIDRDAERLLTGRDDERLMMAASSHLPYPSLASANHPQAPWRAERVRWIIGLGLLLDQHLDGAERGEEVGLLLVGRGDVDDAYAPVLQQQARIG